jgi:protein tyrosine phosphatase (PTP) superfamily phosphohydrolase (DUF442 family)
VLALVTQAFQGGESPSRRKRRWLLLSLLALLPVVLLGYQMGSDSTYFTRYVANAIFRNNFHEVVPGRLYRSAQMSRDELTQTVRGHRIKSIIDLRLIQDAPDQTGLTEAEAAHRGGAIYRHIPFSSARVDQRKSLLDLLSAFETLPRPVLVHCSSGTHRAGVASAVWLLDQEGRSPVEAAGQLTMKYGFFQPERDLKAFFQGRPTLDRAIREYEIVRGRKSITFRDWVISSRLFDIEPHGDERSGR